MKNLYKSILFLFTLVAMVGCMDELENDPIGLLTDAQVDATPSIATIESSVVSSYAPLKNTLNGIIEGWRWDLGTVFRNDILLQDVASNDMNKKWNPDGDQPWMDKLSDFSFTSENQAFNGIWKYDYEGVSRVNLALSFLNDIELIKKTGMDEVQRKQLISEAYFLRAFYYFDLVNNFGDVPLILTTPVSFEEAFAVSIRAEKALVTEQIKSDLIAAKKNATDVKYRMLLNHGELLKVLLLHYRQKWHCTTKIGHPF